MKKMNLSEMRKLSRDEMKQIMAGSGGRCVHNTDWSYQSCGLDQARAESRAGQYAEGSGQHGYWCCPLNLQP